MKQRLKILGLGLIIASSFVVTPLMTESASAQVETGLNMTNKGDLGGKTIGGDKGLVKSVINIMLWAIGIISVIMIIIGGIRYATSNGDSNAASGAKNTILYSVVGLVIAIFAYAIVQFVVDQFVPSTDKKQTNSQKK